jgi:hypothetical protein
VAAHVELQGEFDVLFKPGLYQFLTRQAGADNPA